MTDVVLDLAENYDFFSSFKNKLSKIFLCYYINVCYFHFCEENGIIKCVAHDLKQSMQCTNYSYVIVNAYANTSSPAVHWSISSELDSRHENMPQKHWNLWKYQTQYWTGLRKPNQLCGNFLLCKVTTCEILMHWRRNNISPFRWGTTCSYSLHEKSWRADIHKEMFIELNMQLATFILSNQMFCTV